MRINKWLLLIGLALWVSGVVGQEPKKDNMLLNHLDIAASVGTTGIGIDLAMPIGQHLQVRAGFAYMPQIKYKTDLTFWLSDDYDKSKSEDKDWYAQQSQKTQRLTAMLEELIGYNADYNVDCYLVPTQYNGKFLIDWYPLKKRTWHITGGFYWGPSEFGKAYNCQYEYPTLMAVQAYNTLYSHVLNEEPVISVGGVSAELTPEMNEKILDYGRLSFCAGERPDGTYYHAMPDADGSVSARCYSNRFRPYAGMGWGSAVGKTKRCMISLDCGALFWGGTPKIITHDGEDMSQLVYIQGEDLRSLVKFVKALKVYPVMELRVSWRLF